MTASYNSMLDTLTRLRGIRGAMIVSVEDGLVVAESLMAGLKAGALAALAATLAGRTTDLAQRSGVGAPRFLHLQAAEGALLVAPANSELVLVAVTGRDVPLGLLRLEMLRMAERLT
jgi:predicted regulator of Ras-like GTPase activity (Roadblock/LC7/MglB family)